VQPFTKRVIEVIKSIPEGYVMTYGQVAACAGSPRGARQVVRILHSLSEKHGLPWHRVVNSKGEIAIQEGEGRYMQKLYLENEGVEFGLNGLIDLDEYRYVPELEGDGVRESGFGNE
jgi:Predicted methylated DNA-protein cysteine methyltransferase